MEHQNKHANIKVVSKSVQSDIIVQTEQTLIYNMKSRDTTSSTPIEINYEIRWIRADREPIGLVASNEGDGR